MASTLSGVSRWALRFVLGYFGTLAKMSLLPLVLLGVLSIVSGLSQFSIALDLSLRIGFVPTGANRNWSEVVCILASGWLWVLLATNVARFVLTV